MKLNRMLWTFGNHESLLMYRRIGRRSTGGVQGSAEWMESWHRRFDSEETFARMEEIGANILHCHFYKGMGWEQEKQDLPGLKKTLAAAHRHHITVLAYIQFATLYYELMQREIPNLQAWAARRSDNSFQNYNGYYFRWMPCPENREFRDYLKKISNRVTLFGAFFLMIIALIPTFVFNALSGDGSTVLAGGGALQLGGAFSATGLLIVVSVALEFNKQLESQIMMKHYKGFLK